MVAMHATMLVVRENTEVTSLVVVDREDWSLKEAMSVVLTHVDDYHSSVVARKEVCEIFRDDFMEGLADYFSLYNIEVFLTNVGMRWGWRVFDSYVQNLFDMSDGLEDLVLGRKGLNEELVEFLSSLHRGDLEVLDDVNHWKSYYQNKMLDVAVRTVEVWMNNDEKVGLWKERIREMSDAILHEEVYDFASWLQRQKERKKKQNDPELSEDVESLFYFHWCLTNLEKAYEESGGYNNEKAMDWRGKLLDGSRRMLMMMRSGLSRDLRKKLQLVVSSDGLLEW